MNGVSVADIDIARVSKTRAVSQFFSFMPRPEAGTCSMCRHAIKAGAKRGRNHATGHEYCTTCWPVRG